MRKDIEINTDSGDIAFIKRPPAYSTDLTWVSEDDFYVYGECSLGNSLVLDNLLGGVGVNIPQKDSIKPVKIKFIVTLGNGELIDTGYLIVKDVSGVEVIGSKLILISDDLFFKAHQFTGDTYITLVNGYVRDMIIEPSMEQNEFFLLISHTASIYQYPLTGVGIRSYLNGNLANSNIVDRIQAEWKLDKMSVNNIKQDTETDEIIINSTED